MYNILKIFAVFILFAGGIIGQNRFDGYSFDVEADSVHMCPIRFLPQQNQQNHIEVFLAGTDRRRPASGLKGCENSQATGNRIAPSPMNQKWCFEGPEDLYEIRLSNGNSYLWPAVGRDTGFFNLKDFRPVKRVEGPTVKYEYSDPVDYTKTIKNAMMVLATRQGGTLLIPDGDYVVGTTDGNTRDPSYTPITVPTGVTIIGASSNFSIPTTNMPSRTGATRIRLRNNKQTIFRIGGCTNSVVIRNLELLGNSALFGEAKRDVIGSYGIEAIGQMAINPVTKEITPNTSQFFRFENLMLQNLDTGIMVHNANKDNCNAAQQRCNQWQFDNIRVDHVFFINNRTGIHIDTFNTDWTIANSQFNYIEANAPGNGIHLKRGASILIQNTFGGGYDYESHIGGAFIYIDSVGSLSLVNVSSERSRWSIYTAPATSSSSQMMTVMGSTFGDKIELNGRVTYTSIGNHYFARTIQSAPGVTITSTGDRFCYDPLTMPGTCVEPTTRAQITKPGFDKGRVMFRTGRLPEGRGNTLLDRQPNFFGYDVELNDGVMQFDPNITFKDLAGLVSPQNGTSRVKDGAMVYCKDCRKNNSGQCSQGQAGVDGAFAKRVNGQWRCD